MIIEFVVFDKRDRRLGGLLRRAHVDGRARAVVVHVLDLRFRRMAVELLFDDHLRAEPHDQAHDNAQAHLSDNLETTVEPLFVLAEYLDIVVQETDQPEPHGRNDHQQDVDVGQVAEQQDRDQDRREDDNPAPWSACRASGAVLRGRGCGSPRRSGGAAACG